MKRHISTSLSLIALDSSGKHVRVDNDFVNWTIMEGDGTATLDKNGTLTALKPGRVFVRGELKVAEDYSHVDVKSISIAQKSGEGIAKEPSDAGDVLDIIIALEQTQQQLAAAWIPAGSSLRIRCRRGTVCFNS